MKISRKIMLTLLLIAAVFTLASCGGNKDQAAKPNAEDALSALASGSDVVEETATPAEAVGKYGELDDLSQKVDLKFNVAFGNRNRTMTFNQSTPLTLSNGDVITAGMLKPMWQRMEEIFNSTFTDVTIQDAKSQDMFKTESTNGFKGANIYGGNNLATHLMNYGAQGKFVDLNTLMNGGYMPNYKKYLDENPAIRNAITAYDGGIYYVPYIAEVGTAARQYFLRHTWLVKLLDAEAPAFDKTTELEFHYEPFYVGDNARTGENGGSVSPKAGVVITKKTSENIIEIMNNLPVKNGETLANALREYIARNYDYENLSDLYRGDKAAYDIDELIALLRVVKANPTYLTDGKATEVWPLFTRHSKYREELLRYGTFWDGVRAHGSDTYNSRFELDENGVLDHTYSQEDMYDVVVKLSKVNAEGLIYRDVFDMNNKGNFRTLLYGSDNSDKPSYGFFTYDFIASTTVDGLNSDVEMVLPPVAKVNGVWQYYVDNSRVVKPDGWGISAVSTDAEIKRAASLFDFMFSEEGKVMQNYGLDVDTENLYVGPGGTKWPAFKDWVFENRNLAKGDITVLLRDWIGSQMPIGYPKEIGFEYQNTSKAGFDGWTLLLNSTVGLPSYEGTGKAGDNPNYYKLTPTAYSFTEKQSELLNANTSLGGDDEVEYIFNIIRYAETGNVPNGVVLPADYNEYLAYFEDRGLETYEKIYNAAYQAMQSSNN